MNGPILALLKRFIAFLMSIFATLSLNPQKPNPSGEVDPASFLFASEQAYQDYYLYCTEEDPEPYSWSPEALAAREHVEKELVSGNFSVTLFKNGTARINALTKPVENVTIPAEIEGHSVAAIYSILPYHDYDNASKIAAKVKKAVIPDTVEFIMDGAFEDLSNLREVKFGNRVRFMQANAFRDCSFLTSVVLPDSLYTVPISGFESCLALTSVTLGKNVRILDVCAFYDCPNLKRITLPSSVTEIGKQCFALDSGLSYIYIPASVTSIGDLAFGRCSRLTIHGEKGSAAESYAAAEGIPFTPGK